MEVEVWFSNNGIGPARVMVSVDSTWDGVASASLSIDGALELRDRMDSAIREAQEAA